MESTLELPPTQDQGIEILVELAKAGQIDPWHIDVIDVTDKFLRTLDVSRETDLRLSGRCLFYAAVLLRLKSEAMQEEEQGIDELEYEVDDDSDTMVIRPAASLLDGAISRRKSMKQARTRPTTLVELIAELQRLEAMEREASLERGNELRQKGPVEDRSVHIHRLTHDEDVEGEITRLSTLLSEWLTGMGIVTLSDILTHCTDSRGAFLALLFLDARGKVALSQEEFYGEIAIMPMEPEHHAQDVAA